MRSKITYITIALSIFLFIAISFLGSISFMLKTGTGSLIYFFTTFYVCTKYSDKRLFLFFILLLPSLLCFIFLNILDWSLTLVSLPSNLFLILSILGGYFYAAKKNKITPFFLITSIVCWFIWCQPLFNNWLNFGSIYQKIIVRYPKVLLSDSSNIAYSTGTNKRVVILDFWNTGCGVCYRKFPYIDSINKKLDKTKFEICLVNIPLYKQRKEDNYKRLNEFNYTIKQLFAENTSIADSFGILAYPTTIIVKDNEIRFKGSFENAIKEIVKL